MYTCKVTCKRFIKPIKTMLLVKIKGYNYDIKTAKIITASKAELPALCVT
jgi:hypothetical protein